MKTLLKSKIKKVLKWGAGLSGAAFLGFMQGAGVEKIMAEQVLEAMKVGDLTKIVAYALIFFFIWLEVRGMKKELKNLNSTVSNSFHEGEMRFERIEKKQGDLSHFIDVLKSRLDNIDKIIKH